jgi:sugar O-acyltransferase (sialic acid O-acetyltransferase NeuD family)
VRKPLIIYGAGGLGREVLSIVRGSDLWDPMGFIDDSIARGTVIGGIKVRGTSKDINAYPEPVHVIIALGDPIMKEEVVSRIHNPNVIFPVVIHPSAIIQDASSVTIGAGSIISAGCILTTDIRIGRHVLINLHVTVGHDGVIGDYSSIMPGANIAGEALIGAAVLVGSGANVINRVSIGDKAVVGMGSVVLRSVERGVTVAGVPAKALRP